MTKKQASISVRLIGIMLVITIAGLGLITAISTLMSGNALLQESLGKISKSTELEAERIEAWFGAKEAYFTALATDIAEVGSADSNKLMSILQVHAGEKNEDIFAVYFGWTDGRAIFSDGWEPDADWISYERDWYIGAAEKPGQPYITEPYTDAFTGQLCITISMAVVENGKISGVCAADIMLDVLAEIVNKGAVTEDGYAFLTDSAGNILFHPNQAYMPSGETFQKMQEIENGHFAHLWEQTAENDSSIKMGNAGGVENYYTAQTLSLSGWRFYTAVPAALVNQPTRQLQVVIIPIAVAIVAIVALALYWLIKKIVLRPVREITQTAQQLAQGDTAIQFHAKYEGEMGELADSFRFIANATETKAKATARIAAGDLSAQVPVSSDKDVIGNALTKLLASLQQIITHISTASSHVLESSTQIAANSQTLAQGATEQAGSVSELSTSIGDITAQLRENERRTKTASEAGGNILENVQKGNEQMGRMTAAVNDIQSASNSISRVIKVIEDIAFQTNILALNAAVEAARAGQHGKGFAVVADEVRTLAAKSAEAANETTQLIQNSIDKAEEGARIAGETSESLQAIMDAIGDTVTIIREISEVSADQAKQMAQIELGIEQVNVVVAANAATSEESAASAQELSSEAHVLSSIVQQFRLAEDIEAMDGAAWQQEEHAALPPHV